MIHWPRPELVLVAHEDRRRALDEYCRQLCGNTNRKEKLKQTVDRSAAAYDHGTAKCT